MGKKLPSLGPNILKHLQKNFEPYKGRWIYTLSWIFIAPWEPFSLLCSAPSPSVTRTKEFRRNLELFKSWKKLRFFHKWLYRVEKTNTSAHCRSHKTSERAAVSSPHKCTIAPTNSIWNTTNGKVRCSAGTGVCRRPAHKGPKKHNSCYNSKSRVWLPWRHIIYATMKRAAEDDMSIWWEYDRGVEQMLWWKGCQLQIHKSSWGHECIWDDATDRGRQTYSRAWQTDRQIDRSFILICLSPNSKVFCQ